MNARPIIGGLLLAASTALFAQAPSAPAPADGPKGGPQAKMRGCAQESDPAKCEAQRKEMHEKLRSQYKEAREACKGKAGTDRGSCMTQQMCAKAADPAKCETHARERMEHRREMHEKHQKGGPQAAPKT
jgi:hypothetical protein